MSQFKIKVPRGTQMPEDIILIRRDSGHRVRGRKWYVPVYLELPRLGAVQPVKYFQSKKYFNTVGQAFKFVRLNLMNMERKV